MTRTQRNYGVFMVGYVMIFSLAFLNNQQETMIPFSLLVLPMIVLAGYWEETIGALWMTVSASVTMVGLHLLKIIDPTNAMVSVIVFGLAFVLVAVINYDRENKTKQRQLLLDEKEKELHTVSHKAALTRDQIEGYEKRLKGLVKLYEVSKKLSSILELVPMLDAARLIVSQLMQKHFKSENEEPSKLAIYIPDEEISGFVRMGSRGIDVSDEGFPEKIDVDNLKQWIGEDFNSIRINNVNEEKRLQSFQAIATFRSLIVIPLLMKDIVIGLMMIGSNQVDVFSTNDFNKAEVLGKQIVLALRKALLYRQVQKLSFTDGQTGLYVHRYFQERLNEEIIRSKRYQQDLCLIMMDMDHFKNINDQYGHQIGDEVLIEAAKRIKEISGQTALVARYGGEEFSVVFPNTPIEKAYEIGLQINQHMKATPIQTKSGQIAVTISAGISVFPGLAKDQEKLISSADKALYQAKHEGRDRVIIFQEK